MTDFKPTKPKPLSEESSDSAYSVDKSDSKKELVEEHERLVGVLESDSHEDDKDEAKLQAKELKELKEGKDYKPSKVKKSLDDLAKALKAMTVLGLSRRARMDVAYKVGVSAGSRAAEGPFAAQDLSKVKLNIGITKEQLRPSYEPPVVPVRRVETPGHIAPKPCGDHEYKTATVGPEEAKPFSERER